MKKLRPDGGLLRPDGDGGLLRPDGDVGLLRPDGDVGLQDLIAYFPDNSIMVEIGSYAGESAEIFAKSDKISKLYCIDPWVNWHDKYDTISSFADMGKAESEFDRRTSAFSKIEKIKKPSSEAVSTFKNQSLDVVYIDGCHTYNGCQSDIMNYFPKLKRTGILSGHDYYHPILHKNERGIGVNVVSAVNDTLGIPHSVFYDASWMISMVRFRKYIFNEDFYLDTYLDVKKGVEEGLFTSGLHHYVLHGKNEGRKPI